MTRDEAIINLKLSQNRIGGIKKEEWVALQMAIEALTYQNPSKPNNTCDVDLISRADAINAFWEDSDIRTAEVRATLKALPSADAEWIPCSERLPSKDGCYLVSTTGTNNDIIDIAYYTEEIWHKASRIKAWMPLPEPYREDGE